MKLDHSVYPDLAEPPDTLETGEEKADYVARICGAWDFGIAPTRETLALFATWREVFDRFPLLNSPSFHAVRMLNNWPPLAGGRLQKATYELLDEREGRPPDPFVDRI